MLSRRVPITTENVHEARAAGNWQLALKYAMKVVPKDNDLCQLVKIETDIEMTIMTKGINLDLRRLPGNETSKWNESLDLNYGSDISVEHQLTTIIPNASIGLDARLLSIKYMFMQMQIDKLQDEIGEEQLERIEGKLKSVQDLWHHYRLCSLLADAFCVKGILLEATNLNQTYFMGPNADLAFEQFRKSAELALRYMRELSELIMSTQSQKSAVLTVGSRVAEEALRRIPIYHITKRNLEEAISSLRRFIKELNQTYTQDIRKFLIAQYATTIFSYFRQGNFKGAITLPLLKEINSALPFFQPLTADEETFLALEDAQFTYIDNAVMDEFPENEEARETSRQTAFYTIDMFCLFCSRFGMFENIVESYEEALKISFQNADAWFAYGLSLMASKMYYKAYLVLKECSCIEGCNMNVHILVAQICIDHLALYKEATAILDKLVDGPPTVNKSLAYRSATKLYQHMEFRTGRPKNRQYLQDARADINAAKSIDPFDTDVMYLDAYILAVERKCEEALEKIDFMLNERLDDNWALKLKILIMTMLKKFDVAFELTERYYRERGSITDIKNFDLWLFKVHILTACEVMSIQRVIEKFFERIRSLDIGTVCEELRSSEDAIYEKMLTPLPIRDLFAPSATCRCDCFLTIRSNVHQIWLLAAELYIQAEMYDDAKRCVDDAIAVNHKSAENHYMLGRIEEESGQPEQALEKYQFVLSYQPDHTNSAKRAAHILLNLKDDMVLSSLNCRNALTVDGSDHETWHIYSKCLYKQGYTDEALKCIEKAVDLESTVGIVPLKSICRPLGR